jgi:hypothetical protein
MKGYILMGYLTISFVTFIALLAAPDPDAGLYHKAITSILFPPYAGYKIIQNTPNLLYRVLKAIGRFIRSSIYNLGLVVQWIIEKTENVLSRSLQITWRIIKWIANNVVYEFFIWSMNTCAKFLNLIIRILTRIAGIWNWIVDFLHVWIWESLKVLATKLVNAVKWVWKCMKTICVVIWNWCIYIYEALWYHITIIKKLLVWLWDWMCYGFWMVVDAMKWIYNEVLYRAYLYVIDVFSRLYNVITNSLVIAWDHLVLVAQVTYETIAEAWNRAMSITHKIYENIVNQCTVVYELLTNLVNQAYESIIKAFTIISELCLKTYENLIKMMAAIEVAFNRAYEIISNLLSRILPE